MPKKIVIAVDPQRTWKDGAQKTLVLGDIHFFRAFLEPSGFDVQTDLHFISDEGSLVWMPVQPFDALVISQRFPKKTTIRFDFQGVVGKSPEPIKVFVIEHPDVPTDNIRVLPDSVMITRLQFEATDCLQSIIHQLIGGRRAGAPA